MTRGCSNYGSKDYTSRSAPATPAFVLSSYANSAFCLYSRYSTIPGPPSHGYILAGGRSRHGKKNAFVRDTAARRIISGGGPTHIAYEILALLMYLRIYTPENIDCHSIFNGYTFQVLSNSGAVEFGTNAKGRNVLECWNVGIGNGIARCVI
jgi:hypothetical protein